MRAIYTSFAFVPMLLVAGISAYWAVTSDPWWLVGVFSASFMTPSVQFKTETPANTTHTQGKGDD